MKVTLLIAILLLMTAVCTFVMIRADWIERPTDSLLIQNFIHAHGSFESLRCDHSSASNQRVIASTKGKWIGCDYDGSFRVVFGGNHLGLAIGPGWSKGLTYIPRANRSKGLQVKSTDKADKLKADIYLRQIEGNWFIYYQRYD